MVLEGFSSHSSGNLGILEIALDNVSGRAVGVQGSHPDSGDLISAPSFSPLLKEGLGAEAP